MERQCGSWCPLTNFKLITLFLGCLFNLYQAHGGVCTILAKGSIFADCHSKPASLSNITFTLHMSQWPPTEDGKNCGGAWFGLTQKVNLFISQLSRGWSLRKHGHYKKGGKFVLLEGPAETRSTVCVSMLSLSTKQAWECSHSMATITSAYSSCSIHWYQHGFHR
jgi:hypothetical protein